MVINTDIIQITFHSSIVAGHLSEINSLVCSKIITDQTVGRDFGSIVIDKGFAIGFIHRYGYVVPLVQCKNISAG